MVNAKDPKAASGITTNQTGKNGMKKPRFHMKKVSEKM